MRSPFRISWIIIPICISVVLSIVPGSPAQQLLPIAASNVMLRIPDSFDVMKSLSPEEMQGLADVRAQLGLAIGASALQYMNKVELYILRNSIYAQYGYKFTTPWLKNYFLSRSWYKESNVQNFTVSTIDLANIKLIQNYETKLSKTSSFEELPQRGTIEPQIIPRVYSSWVKNFNGIEIFNSICQTNDNGFILSGKTHPDGICKALLIKFDMNGNIQWQIAFGKYPEINEFYSAFQTNDGGYFMFGRHDLSIDQRGGLLVKLTPQGAIQYQKFIPDFYIHHAIQRKDGDLVLIGESIAFGSSGSFVIAQLAANGKFKWQKNYGAGQGQIIKQIPEGGYIALGKIWDLGSYKSLIIKIDDSGNIIWQQLYYGLLNAVERVDDGGFLFCGTINVAGIDEHLTGKSPAEISLYYSVNPRPMNAQAWLLKLDSTGNIQWQKQYGGVFEDDFISIHSNGTKNFILLGNTKNYGAGYGDMWLLSISEDGSILWQKTIGGQQLDTSTALEVIKDGGFLIAGWSISIKSGHERGIIIKTNNKVDDMSNCSKIIFSESNSVPADFNVSPTKPHFPIKGQDITLRLNNSSIVSFDPKLPIVSQYPPAPKMVFVPMPIKICTESKNTTCTIEGSIENIGSADLVVKEIKLIQEPVKQPLLPSTSAATTKASEPLFSIAYDCPTLSPYSRCNYTLNFKSPETGEFKATLIIVSNDPDTPTLEVPIHAVIKF